LTIGLNQHLRSCTVAEARHLQGLVLPRDRFQLQDRLMDSDNGVEFVDNNRVDMRSSAFEIVTPLKLDGSGSGIRINAKWEQVSMW
jgi:hypothetical protein